VKDRQDSFAARIAGTIAGGVRRRQQDRTPRALVYDASGEPRVVAAGSEAQVGLIAVAQTLVDAVLGEEAEPAASEEVELPAGDDADPPAGDDGDPGPEPEGTGPPA
jgi:hypothetical protein